MSGNWGRVAGEELCHRIKLRSFILKNKLFCIITLLVLSIFSTVNTANAVIYSEDDIQIKIEQLEQLCDFDFLSLINKSELIGFRLQNFRMSSQLYSNSIIVTIDNLKNIVNQIELVKNSADFSGTEKDMQINKLLHSADTALFELDTKTMSYLMDLRISMPTITYDRYIRKFQDYYNNLGLTGSALMVE